MNFNIIGPPSYNISSYVNMLSTVGKVYVHSTCHGKLRKLEHDGITIIVDSDCQSIQAAYNYAGVVRGSNPIISTHPIYAVDEIWTLSMSERNAIMLTTDIPVYYIPPMYAAYALGRATPLHIQHDKFTILTNLNENLQDVVLAYRSEFDTDERTKLIVCATSINNDVRSFCKKYNIAIIDGIVDYNDFISILLGCNCFVSVHNSTDLAIIDSLCYGIPTIALRTTANADYVFDAQCFTVRDGHLLADVAKHLRWVVDNRQTAVRLSTANCAQIKKRYNGADTRRVISERVEWLSNFQR